MSDRYFFVLISHCSAFVMAALLCHQCLAVDFDDGMAPIFPSTTYPLPMSEFTTPNLLDAYGRSGEGNEEDNLVWTEAPNDLELILKDHIRYNRFLAPGQIHERSTNVQVALYIESMSSFKAQTMDFEMDLYLAMMWFDERLKHKHQNPVLITDLRIAGAMWFPDLYFVNSKSATLQAVTTPNFMVLVYGDGLVFKALRVAVTLSCNMDFLRFPLDEQECPILLQSYAYVEQVVNLTWFVNPGKGYPISSNEHISLSDMQIIDKNAVYCGGVYPMLRGQGRWSCLKGMIKMKRMVEFYVFQTYIPTAMLVCISWLSFWLDPRASPARISLTITTLLTLTTLANGARQGLPQVNYVKAMDIWLNMCTGFVFCVLLEYTTVCYYVSKRHAHCVRHVNYMSTFRNGHVVSETSKTCPTCSACSEKSALRIDKISRAVFPIGFFISAGSYWLYYLSTYLDWSSEKS